MNKKSDIFFKIFTAIFCGVIAICISSCKVSYIYLEDLIDHQEGKVIYLKEGTYVIRRTLNIEAGYTIIGQNTVLKVSSDFTYPIISIVGKHNVLLENITLEGPRLQDERNSIMLAKYNYMHGVVLKNSDQIVFRNVTISNIKGSGVKATDCKYLDFIDCTFENIGVSTFQGTPYSSDGIYLGGYKYIKDVKIDNCVFTNISSSFEAGSPPWPNDGDGVHILTAGVAKDITITDCTFEKCSARGVKIQSGENVVVENSKFASCRSAVILPMLNSVRNVTISGNKILDTDITFGTDKAGPFMDATNITITNNIVDRCDHFFRASGTSNLRDSEISNNTIEVVERFVIAGRLYNTEIVNNVVENYAAKADKSWNMAILLNPESEDVLIENNTFIQKDGRKRLIDNRAKKGIRLRNNREK